MNQIFKCVVGSFNINDAFSAVDLLSDDAILSVSCFQRYKSWVVEILSTRKFETQEIYGMLSDYEFSVIENVQMDEENWLEKCFENFRPINVGGFYIYGPHLRSSNHPSDKMMIEIAAATAFGTGEHPTTNRCLVACETFFDPRKHKKALDIGCGSCILSIALARLGARDIVACDNDAEAVRVSQENVEINKVASRVKVFQNQACEFSENKYDFVVANILAEPLISMSDYIVESLASNGILVLSGFTSDDDSVEKRFISLGLKIKHKYDYNGWTTLVLESASKSLLA
ncbi:MAG: 50S ribosomal protein L11 methyltransferase [Alphaproteobacteria bacterium]|nr:50S ribosomal protein L11 methyltransferase [Alphaproteobacteria bacterium]MBO7642265.1 50S ribosomal protein L11 methyltransferase [Alphaproteobacteria bacterium]